jgi:hypothetical protein
MVLTGHDPRNWESTENRFYDCASRAAGSMSSETYQGSIHKLILQQKSKENPEFNDYPVVVWLFLWTDLCIWLFEGIERVRTFHFQSILINHVIWVVPYRRDDSRIWSNIYSQYFQIDFLCDSRLWIDESRFDPARTHLAHGIPAFWSLNFGSSFQKAILSISREEKGDGEREIKNLDKVMSQYRK